MNRIDRLMGIMTVLQAKKYSTAEKLSERFSISVRTVYRDIKALNDIGVPVHFEQPKGYFIAQGYFLPPLSFTAEEANALILLQALAGRFADRSIQKHSVSALQKIKTVLRSWDKDRAETISSTTGIYIKEDEQTHAWLTPIQEAIAQQKIISVTYKDNNGKETQREIEPVGLIFYTFQWHLVAWCHLRKGYRDFKVKEITQLRATQLPFRRKHAFDPEEYMKLF